MKRASGLALLGLVLLSQPLAGQSLLGSQGLGTLMEPLDARARALGTSGVGLWGPSLTPVDLASAARIYLPTAQVTLQPQWVDGDLGGQPLNTQGTRFPQMGLAYPVVSLGGTAVLHIGSFLDQRWEVSEQSDQMFRGESVPVTDIFRSDGGVSTFQAGWAQRFGDRLSLGVGIGARMGSVTRSFQRTVDAGADFIVVPFRTGAQWQYSGAMASLGFQWDPLQVLRLAGTASWSGDLRAKPTGSTEGGSLTYRLPVEYRLGASGILTPKLAVSLGAYFADWKPSPDGLEPETLVGSVWSFGGGLEWAGLVMGIRNFPLRLGMKRSTLPFTFEGENPTENVLTGGIGFNLLPPQAGLIGVVDLGFEKGKREAASLSESFWRVSVTFRVGSF